MVNCCTADYENRWDLGFLTPELASRLCLAPSCTIVLWPVVGPVVLRCSCLEALGLCC